MWLDDNLQPVDKAIATHARISYPDGKSVYAEVVPALAKATKSGKLIGIKSSIPPTEDIDVLRADLRNRLKDAFSSYAGASSRGGRAFISDAKQALQEDLSGAFYAGYREAAGDGAETEDDDESWLTATLSEQQSYLDDAFKSVRGAANDESITEDDIDNRVEKWGGTLDGVYSQGILRGSKNLMCYFAGDDGKESCATCQRLQSGPNRSVRYILSHGLNPYPGNPNFECGNWECAHNWFSVKDDSQVTF